jgi:hypothetical protein
MVVTLFVFGLLRVDTLSAQVTTNTSCSVQQYRYSNSASIACNTVATQDPWATFARSFQRALEASQLSSQLRRQEELLARQNGLIQASVDAQATRIAYEKDEARQAARERAEAAARLFWRRASVVVSSLGDSLNLGPSGQAALLEDARPILQDLFVTDATASTAQIQDNLVPIWRPLQRRSIAFDGEVNGWLRVNRTSLLTLGPVAAATVARAIDFHRQRYLTGARTEVSAALDQSLTLLESNTANCLAAAVALERWVSPSSRARVARPDTSICTPEFTPEAVRARWAKAAERADSAEVAESKRKLAIAYPRRAREFTSLDALVGKFAAIKNWSPALRFILAVRTEYSLEQIPPSEAVNVDSLVNAQGAILDRAVVLCVAGKACDRQVVDTATYRKFVQAARR